MEDTAWPYPGGLQAYLGKAGTLYDQTLSSQKQEGRASSSSRPPSNPSTGRTAPTR